MFIGRLMVCVCCSYSRCAPEILGMSPGRPFARSHCRQCKQAHLQLRVRLLCMPLIKLPLRAPPAPGVIWTAPKIHGLLLSRA